MNVIVATPRLVKMLDGSAPVPPVSMPITAGNGPFPAGVVMVVVSVIDPPPSVTFTVSWPPEKVAVRLAGGAGLVPSS